MGNTLGSIHELHLFGFRVPFFDVRFELFRDFLPVALMKFSSADFTVVRRNFLSGLTLISSRNDRLLRKKVGTWLGWNFTQVMALVLGLTTLLFGVFEFTWFDVGRFLPQAAME